MKPFVINRYGRIVFPFNFFPELDFSVFQTLEQFEAVIKRDFEEKAPTETDIVARIEARDYGSRYEILRDAGRKRSARSCFAPVPAPGCSRRWRPGSRVSWGSSRPIPPVTSWRPALG